MERGIKNYRNPNQERGERGLDRLGGCMGLFFLASLRSQACPPPEGQGLLSCHRYIPFSVPALLPVAAGQWPLPARQRREGSQGGCGSRAQGLAGSKRQKTS